MSKCLISQNIPKYHPCIPKPALKNISQLNDLHAFGYFWQAKTTRESFGSIGDSARSPRASFHFSEIFGNAQKV